MSDGTLRAITFVAVLVGASLLFALMLLPSVAATGRVVQSFTEKINGIGGDTDIAFPRFPERSIIYADDGSILATVFFDENRKYVELDKVNEVARQAVLAVEDAKFYEHKGIDTLGVVRAAAANFLAGEVEQGASTVSQQLARNAFPAVGTERTLARKLHELQVAMRLEERYSKDEILELYLNRVYFGRGVYGIGTAAEFYFGKSSEDLTTPEAALLAGLIASPEKFSPVNDEEAALERRNHALHRMAVIGHISKEEAARLSQEPIELDLHPPEDARHPFFVDFIKRRILDDERFGATREARTQTLFQGGLRIHSTLEPKLERHGRKVIKNHLPDKQDPEAAIASVDARTGAIKALVSSQNFKRSQVNLATGEGGTGRQIGSSMKIVGLVAGFEQGIPQSKVYNGQHGILVEECNPPYRVHNADGSGGHMDLWTATQRSVNAVFVQLAVDAGLEKLVETGHRLGIKSKIQPFCSTVLGTSEVNPLEMASVFATVANEGKHCEPYAIEDVKDRDGNQVAGFPQTKKENCEQVLDKKIAALVANMLMRVVQGGTGTAANLSDAGPWPHFGKTGSTNDLKDATFGGCTRQVCSFVWVGHQEALIPMTNVHGRRVFGGTFPAMIWHDFMVQAMKGMKPLSFPPAPKPETATVPDVVGKTEEEAKEILAEANFTPVVKEVRSTEEAGTVAKQSPGGGSRVPAGSQVQIGVSNGKAPNKKIPNVVGMSEKEAVSALKKRGFAVKVTYEETPKKDQGGKVKSQSPGGGRAKEGSTVTIVVWKHKAQPSPSPSPSP